MTLFSTHRYNWWHVALLKISVLSLGIIIGSSWPEVFVPYAWHLLIAAVVFGLYPAYVWLKQ